MAKTSFTVDTIVKKSTAIDNPPAKAPSKPAPTKSSSIDMTYVMSYKKDTPGTYVYASDDPDAFVNQVYVRKGGMPDGALKMITITVR